MSTVSNMDFLDSQLANSTLDELDWVLYQLDSLQTHTSVSEMASNKVNY